MGTGPGPPWRHQAPEATTFSWKPKVSKPTLLMLMGRWAVLGCVTVVVGRWLCFFVVGMRIINVPGFITTRGMGELNLPFKQ